MNYLLWAVGAPLFTGAVCFLLGYAFGVKTEIIRHGRIQDKE